MYLNKNGWGLRDMILLSSVLILFLFVAAYYIYMMYDEIEVNDKVTNYSLLEEKLEKQTKIYLNDYYNANLTSDYVTITRSVLRGYDLDVSLMDNNGDYCSGYTTARKTKGVVHIKAYIKCDDYETEGYEEWREN